VVSQACVWMTGSLSHSCPAVDAQSNEFAPIFRRSYEQSKDLLRARVPRPHRGSRTLRGNAQEESRPLPRFENLCYVNCPDLFHPPDWFLFVRYDDAERTLGRGQGFSVLAVSQQYSLVHQGAVEFSHREKDRGTVRR